MFYKLSNNNLGDIDTDLKYTHISILFMLE